jgi:hypothetical protein
MAGYAALVWFWCFASEVAVDEQMLSTAAASAVGW